MAVNVNIDTITIMGRAFRGIGWQGLLTVNTKTYVESPTRTNDGSIPNIKDHETFSVPRAKVNFKLLSIEDYQDLCEIINAYNEFPVTYWDKQVGAFVTHNMYCEPEEMKKLFNIGTKIIGVLDYEVSFIGTLNNLETCAISYYLNSSNSDSSILSTTSVLWGRQMEIIDGTKVAELATTQGYTLPTGKNFSHWNTKRDGTGVNYYPSTKATFFATKNLYAQWTT